MKSQLAIDGRAETYWFIEPGYTTVQFNVKNFFFFTVSGRLTEVAGTIINRESEIGHSSVEVTIKVASIDTGNKRRDAHLRSADFMDADNYPEITFRSTKVEKGRDRDALIVTGMLTIKDISRETVLAVTEVDRSRSPQGEEIAYYSATTEIDRHDLGVSFRRGLIGGKLKINIHVQAQKQASIRLSEN
ncbi:MAG: YceI family protein [Acidobacteriota bacterium]